jgi:hypothetical protein
MHRRFRWYIAPREPADDVLLLGANKATCRTGRYTLWMCGGRVLVPSGSLLRRVVTINVLYVARRTVVKRPFSSRPSASARELSANG